MAKQHAVLVDPRDTLLELLRDRIGLTGTKEGCGNGNCGTCTVLMDGAPVNACLVLAMEAAEQEVLTIEGLASRGELHPMQSLRSSRRAAPSAASARRASFCRPRPCSMTIPLLASRISGRQSPATCVAVPATTRSSMRSPRSRQRSERLKAWSWIHPDWTGANSKLSANACHASMQRSASPAKRSIRPISRCQAWRMRRSCAVRWPMRAFVGIDTARAKAMQGVLAVVTAADFPAVASGMHDPHG